MQYQMIIFNNIAVSQGLILLNSAPHNKVAQK